MEPMGTITSPEQLVNLNLAFDAAVIDAIGELAESRIWRISRDWDERIASLAECVAKMSAGELGKQWQLVHVGSKRGLSSGAINHRLHRITISGRLSVVTVLFWYAQACKKTNLESMVFAVTLFKRFFPRSFARCKLIGGMIVNLGRSDK